MTGTREPAKGSAGTGGRLAHRRTGRAPGRRAGRLTGERPREELTPGSLLALHDAGYRAVLERLGPGRVLDVGCGEGFESVRMAGPGRWVLAVDYSKEATQATLRRGRSTCRSGLEVAEMDAVALGLATGAFDSVCSSHLIEHFSDPAAHVAEVARVTAPAGTAYFLTPNAPADFENPFHLHLFGPDDLAATLRRFFDDVRVDGLDATERVKADFASRRAKAQRVLRLDVFGLRHRIPRRWYLALYTRLLPLAYRVLAVRDRTGAAMTADDWFVTAAPDETTLVLFACCRRPRRWAPR